MVHNTGGGEPFQKIITHLQFSKLPPCSTTSISKWKTSHISLNNTYYCILIHIYNDQITKMTMINFNKKLSSLFVLTNSVAANCRKRTKPKSKLPQNIIKHAKYEIETPETERVTKTDTSSFYQPCELDPRIPNGHFQKNLPLISKNQTLDPPYLSIS